MKRYILKYDEYINCLSIAESSTSNDDLTELLLKISKRDNLSNNELGSMFACSNHLMSLFPQNFNTIITNNQVLSPKTT